MWNDFKSFLIKQNVLSLAVALVVGTALTALVKALVDDFIMPIVSAALPSGDWQHATWSVGSVKFGVGDFLAVLINFIIIGIVAWRISKALIRPPKDAAAAMLDCRYCKMKIDRSASRCPYCTSEISASAPV